MMDRTSIIISWTQIKLKKYSLATKTSFLDGRLTPQTIEANLAGTYQDHTYMTCGPQGMMDDIISHLKLKQVKPELIKQESFQN